MSEALTVGSLAYDTRAKRLGEVMAVDEAECFLRPRGGGYEWDVPRELVRPATDDDRLAPPRSTVPAAPNPA